MKKSIIIYADCIAILEELTYEQAGRLFRAILSYINDEPITEIANDPAVNMAFKVIKRQIDRDAEKYALICERRRENINKRWHKEGQDTNHTKGGKSIQVNTNVNKSIQTDYNNDTDSENENDTEVTTVTIKSANADNLAPNGALSPQGDAINFDGLVKFFNSMLKKYNSVICQIKDIKGKRRDAVRARSRERGKKSLAIVFENAAKSDFLNGKNDRGFIASFDWLIKPNNFIKVLEGNYNNEQNGTGRKSSGAEQTVIAATEAISGLLADNE